MSSFYKQILHCTHPLHAVHRLRKGLGVVRSTKTMLPPPGGGCDWCPGCQLVESSRYERAYTDGYINAQPNPCSIRDYYGTKHRLRIYAQAHAPADMRWCNWGLHYAPTEEYKFRHVKGYADDGYYQSNCQWCDTASDTYHRQVRKRKALAQQHKLDAAATREADLRAKKLQTLQRRDLKKRRRQADEQQRRQLKILVELEAQQQAERAARAAAAPPKPAPAVQPGFMRIKERRRYATIQFSGPDSSD